MQYPEEVIIVTTSGKFYLKISPNKNRNLSIDSYTLSLGSETKKCVQLTVNQKEGKLLWVESENDCSLEKYVEKKFVQHMVNLIVTIGLDISPSLEKIFLDDTSSFKCKIPYSSNISYYTDGISNNKIKVSMAPFHIAFHGGTWYEYYFNAQLVKEYDVYLKKIKNMKDSSFKPPTFDFNNSDVQDILEPMYLSSDTWYDFFKIINDTFTSKKCAVVYPWIKDAMYSIFESEIFMNTKWVITIKDNEKLLKIPFSSYEVVRGGSKAFGILTRKRTPKIFYSPGTNDTIPPDIIKDLTYKKFLKNLI